MTAGCTTLEVYAQQYGVLSQKTVYYICYGKTLQFFLPKLSNVFCIFILASQ